MDKWKVWKHDCITHGMGDGVTCLPRCNDPWQADDPKNKWNNTFATWAQAIRWADKRTRRQPTRQAPDDAGASDFKEDA